MLRRSSRSIRLAAYLLPIPIIALVAEVLFALPMISVGAAAPVLLLAVLLIARSLGTGPALIASTCAGIAFSLYFLPPSGRFIKDPNDWVAFITFSITAVVTGELAARAERRQVDLEEGKREIEQLYAQLGAAFERASEAEAARRNEQLKSALLDALTHNLRTPLTAIKASVTAMLSAEERDQRAALTPANRRELLHVIDEESDRLNLFIEGLSAADRQEGVQPVSLRAVSVDQVVRETVERASTVSRRHKVAESIAPDLPLLAVDRAAVSEALYTVLDNASKYSPANSTIRIRAEQVSEHELSILVEDEGPGIPPELREQVFQKFYRIPGRASADPRRTGIGLGLPIAKRLVESQGGQIALDTPASGRGTRVVLRLPCVAHDSEKVEDAPMATALQA